MVLDPGTVLAAAALATGALIVPGAVVALFFAHSGPRRAALVASAVPLGLLLPVAAVSLASFRFIKAFSRVAESVSTPAVVEDCRRAWTVVRGGAGTLSFVALLTLLLVLVPSRERPGAAPCSLRRALVLLGLPVCALLLAAGLVGQLRSAMRVAYAVVTPTTAAERAAAERVMVSEGLGEVHGSAGIAAVSTHIASRGILGSLGAPVVAVVLLGLAAAAVPIAARVRVGPVFVALACVLLLLLTAASAALALGVGDPLRLG